MPRAKSPKRETAYTLWLDSGKTMKLRDIATRLNIPEKTISGWKAKDCWDNKNERSTPKNERSTPNNKRGAQPGNQNAVGNSGGAPLGNKNSEKHGIYSSVFWDALDEQEAQLIDNMPTDEEQHLLDEIRLLTVRERRLMQKIRDLSDSPHGMVVSEVFRSETRRTFDGSDEEKEADKELYNSRQRDKIDRNELLPGRAVRIDTSAINNSDLLLRAHAELTRVQSQKTRCVEALNKIRQSKENAMGNSMANDWIAALTGGDDEYGQN